MEKILVIQSIRKTASDTQLCRSIQYAIYDGANLQIVQSEEDLDTLTENKDIALAKQYIIIDNESGEILDEYYTIQPDYDAVILLANLLKQADIEYNEMSEPRNKRVLKSILSVGAILGGFLALINIMLRGRK